ncbi:MAG: Ig-like domain-containing protein, partial [Bacteroidetes bacterium]|nr:Ig-like domain-containing protein [Bacteroidota bacterium]
MKLLLNKNIVFFFWFLLVVDINAQTYNTNLKVGDPVPDWFVNEEPTYEIIKQKFIKHYGEDKDGWPFFITESDRLFTQFQDYNKTKKNRKHPKYSEFFNNELGLGNDLTKNSSYLEQHKNAYRNYAILTNYIIIRYKGSSSEWTTIQYEGNPAKKTFLEADSTDGILPLVLYTYVSNIYNPKCPIGMLDWYFEDVFPVIDLLYQQDELDDVIKILESVRQHSKKLIDNYDFVKAKIWMESVYQFISLYHFEYLRPEIENKYEHHLWLNNPNIEEKQKEAIELFQLTFDRNISNNLGGLSYRLIYPAKEYWTPKHSYIGELVFDNSGKSVIEINKKFSDEYYSRFERHCHEVQDYSVGFPITGSTEGIQVRNVFIGSDVFVSYPETTVFSGIIESVHGNNIDSRGLFTFGEQKYLFAFSEKCGSSLNFVLKMPHLNYYYLTLYGMEVTADYIAFEEKYKSGIQRLATYAFVKTVNDVLNNKTIVPQIYGMKYNKKRMTRNAITASTYPREVKTDGKSTTEITAILFEYTPGTDIPSTPISGKTVQFSINEQYGIVPGTLNTESAVTDINGQVKVIYTAPMGDSLQKTDKKIVSTAVNVFCDELNVEELAYISFASDKGEVRVSPPYKGIVSNQGIVPPDSRFPALITVSLEDDHLEPMPNTEVSVIIKGDKPLGKIRSENGEEGISLNLISDSKGDLEFQYFYAVDTPPDKPVTEIIEIKTPEMAIPIRAYVTIGLNIVFELVENAYEGKGELNAEEKIPIKIKIKDAWNPEIDLTSIINYWSIGKKTGDNSLNVKLDIENISTVPQYLMEQIKLQNYPEPAFSENMAIKSFKDKKIYNILMLKESSLKDYMGYPKINPTVVGNHYYEASITLVDDQGQEVFQTKHPAHKALFNVETGMAADAMQIFFISNPFATETKDAKLLATA